MICCKVGDEEALFNKRLESDSKRSKLFSSSGISFNKYLILLSRAGILLSITFIALIAFNFLASC